MDIAAATIGVHEVDDIERHISVALPAQEEEASYAPQGGQRGRARGETFESATRGILRPSRVRDIYGERVVVECGW